MSAEDERPPELPYLFAAVEDRFTFSYDHARTSPMPGREWLARCRRCGKGFWPMAIEAAIANMLVHRCAEEKK